MSIVGHFQLKYSILFILAELLLKKKQPHNKCDLIYHYSYKKKNLEDCPCSSY